MSKLPDLIETKIQYYIYQNRWKSKIKLHNEYHRRIRYVDHLTVLGVYSVQLEFLNDKEIWTRVNKASHNYGSYLKYVPRRIFSFTNSDPIGWMSSWRDISPVGRFFYSSGMNHPSSYSNDFSIHRA